MAEIPNRTLQRGLDMLELLGKHLGMFEDRLKVAAKVDTGKLDGILAQLRGGPPDG